MALKTLGTATNLTATVEATIYTVPASKESHGIVTFCNQTSGQALIRLRVKPSADTLGTQHYLEYNYPLMSAGNVGNVVKVRVSMATGDVIYAYSDTTNVSCSVQGDETAPTS